MKQESIRSLGRRAGCLRIASSSPLNIQKIFEQNKTSHVTRKADPFSDYFQERLIMNSENMNKYNIAKNKKRPINSSGLGCRSKKLLLLHSNTLKLKDQSKALLVDFKKKTQYLKRFMTSKHKNIKMKSTRKHLRLSASSTKQVAALKPSSTKTTKTYKSRQVSRNGFPIGSSAIRITRRSNSCKRFKKIPSEYNDSMYRRQARESMPLVDSLL